MNELGMNDLRSVLLLIHAISACVWVVVCLGLAVVTGVLRATHEEFKDFGARVVPRLNTVSIVAAGLLLLTGITNVILLGLLVGFNFSPAFVAILAGKLVLYILMALWLHAAWRLQAELRGPVTKKSVAAMRRLGTFAGMSALAGAAALSLALWLMGTPVG